MTSRPGNRRHETRTSLQGVSREQHNRPGDQPQHVSSPLHSTDENEETIITSIRVTDVTLGLRRLPAGFYIAVHHSGLEWKTENKRPSMNDDIVEWSDSIPIPSDLQAVVCLKVYASLEFQPMLGAGELLRRLTFTAKQLLDCSARDVPFTLFPKDGEVVSPCSSILVAVKRRKCKSSDPSGSRAIGGHGSTTESRDKLEDATNQGHSALSRYRKQGTKRDLECSVEQFERALVHCPLNHPGRGAVQSNLATAKFILCQVDDTNASFDVPLGLYRNTLNIRPPGHLDRPSTLIQLAAVHLALFEKRRDDVEGARVEGLLDEAIELSSTESYEYRAATFMHQLHARLRAGVVQGNGVGWDSALRFTDEDLESFSLRLLHRFDKFGDLTDLQQAIAVLEELVRSTSVWNDRHRAGLGNLGVALSYRFSYLGELSDLEEAISTLRNAVDLTPDGHPGKSAGLSNLGGTFLTRFERLGELSDLEDAICRLKDAVDLTPHRHPDKPASLNNLGYSLITRFECLGDPNDLEGAISICRDAVNLTPHSHLDKPSRLSNLGTVLITRFECLGELSDLDEAISILRDAVDFTPDGHPDKTSCLSNLGNSLRVRFRRFGELSDLEEAISMFRDAVKLIPRDHSQKSTCLHNLGVCLLVRFERIGELNDLEDAISMLRDSVELILHGHVNKAMYLSNLGTSFQARFQRLGELSDLEAAISAHRDSVDLTPCGHFQKPARLVNFSNCLRTRFRRLGEPHDIEDAISMARDALDLVSDGHPIRPTCLVGLGDSFRVRFEHFGELSDLEDAILMLSNAVRITPHDHPLRPICLNNLGNCFRTRFDRLGELVDLEGAVSGHSDALDLISHGHADRPGYLNNLGNSLITRFEHQGELSDLEDAISLYRDAVDLLPDGHSNKPGHLSNLGRSLVTRFLRLGELGDLEDAILRHRDAVNLTPPGHPDRPNYLNNLGDTFNDRFKHLGDLDALQCAVSMLRDAIDLTPPSHPDKPMRLENLGNCFRARFEHFGEPSDLEQAISLYSKAASIPIGPISVRFQASQKWISCARRICHHSLFHAYSVAISLLPELAWIGLSLTYRYNELIKGANVVREAAAAALDSGFPEVAVEWLEQGRSIVWGELFQLRSSYEELSSVHPDHARRLRELSAALEHAGVTRERSISALFEQTEDPAHHAIEPLQQNATRHRRLAIERDKLVREIRGFPGFERFLLHKEFTRLRASAHAGPVVILNAAESRCDALILLAEVDHVVHVPLPNFTFKQSVGLQKTMRKLLRHAHVIGSEDREGKCVKWDGVSWESFLSPLWKYVVKPVLDALGFSAPGDLSRIFWCPTGPFVFLPIHAAGFYNSEHLHSGHKVYDFIVSSYVPTLSVLILPTNLGTPPSRDFRLLAVGQPHSDGLARLPGVATELKHVEEVVRNSLSPRTTLLESSVGTVEEVLALMKDADWVHFACHGIQDAVYPIDSGLCLADRRRLKISDIIALSRPHGGLAFLSACQTATGDEDLSDEAIHIAAGMLFAGYGGVVGTMWSISDNLAPRVARDVYTQLFRNGTRPDYREAARALHKAIGRLRESNATFDEWLPFIHVGL